MNWEEMIPKCFGVVNKVYAGHEVEKQHARKMISAAKKAEVSRDEVADALRGYLKQKKQNESHIEEQIKTFMTNTRRQVW